MNLLTIEHLTKSYTERLLFNDTAFSINEGEKVGLIGINGTGKSTLLRIAAGLEEPDGGTVVKGRSLYIRYLPQIPEFTPGDTILDSIVRDNKNEPHFSSVEELKASAKTMLNRLEIEDFDAKVETLSGGQRKRVALASVLLSTADLLILDEPTNDLDIQTLILLEDYLDTFPGIVITVSHDRYFLDRVVNRIFAFEGNGVVQQYEGGFTDYQRAWNERHPQISGNGAGAGNAGSGKASDKDTDEENAANAKAVNKNNWKETSGAQKKLRLSYKEQREWETIEGDIAGLEEAIAALETEIEKSASNYTRLNELMKEKTEKEAQLEEKMDRWMYLTDLVEQIESQK